MSSPYLGEIRCFGFNFAPQGWAFCNGQLLAISQNDALFAVIGTTYGGDGSTTFGLPNLQGKIPMHWGNGPGGFNTTLGEVQGSPTVTLSPSHMPTHTHVITSELVLPGGVNEHLATATVSAFIGPSAPDMAYKTSPAIDTAFSPLAISSSGGSQPHENMQPYLTINFCIALEGIFPTQ